MKKVRLIQFLILLGMGYGSFCLFFSFIRPSIRPSLSSDPVETVVFSQKSSEESFEQDVGSFEKSVQSTNQGKEEADQLMQKTFEAIPTIDQLRQLSEEDVHFSPLEITQAGRKLGSLAQYLEEHPEAKITGIRFYQQCASQGRFPTSMRALCFYYFESLYRAESDAYRHKLPGSVVAASKRLK